MNKKGQIIGVGIFVMMFLTILVGVILLDASADEVGRATTIFTRTNETQVAPANGSALNFTGFKELNNVVIYNYTNGTAGTGSEILDNGPDYQIKNNVVFNGQEISQIVVYNNSIPTGARWNVTYDGTPDTYISSGGARSIADLILVFFALAIATVALVPSVRSRVFNM